MKLHPHLNFSGNCADALQFYEQHLGAKTLFTITYGSSPMAGQFPVVCHDKIMHATLEVGGAQSNHEDDICFRAVHSHCFAFRFEPVRRM